MTIGKCNYTFSLQKSCSNESALTVTFLYIQFSTCVILGRWNLISKYWLAGLAWRRKTFVNITAQETTLPKHLQSSVREGKCVHLASLKILTEAPGTKGALWDKPSSGIMLWKTHKTIILEEKWLNEGHYLQRNWRPFKRRTRNFKGKGRRGGN